uniref:Uncharacterized protein n=1 Tax=Tanacetum cinerariifolium TaxID=118510 RepID=A0A6L2NIL1_TANCI|nr:hypothetical protein [Tanacetum cinerariifolium]
MLIAKDRRCFMDIFAVKTGILSLNTAGKRLVLPDYLNIAIIGVTKISQSSGPTNLVADETLYKEWKDRMERAATTASSLEAEQDSGNINRTQSMVTLNEPLPQGTSTAKVKKVNGQEQIQALVDKQKVIIMEESIRCDLKFDDVEGTACLPNDIIFKELARMCAKTTAWNEFSSTMASDIIYKHVEGMAKHKEIYVISSHTKKIFANMRRQGQGFSGNVTPLFETMMVTAQEEVGESSGKDSLGAQEDASKQRKGIEDIDQDAEIVLVDESQGRMHDAYMFGVDDLEVTAANVEDNAALTTATTANVDDELTLAKTLIEIKVAKPKVISTAITTPKAKGIIFHEQVQVHIPTVISSKDKGKAQMIEPEKPLKKKDQIALDEEVARKAGQELEQESAKKQKLAEQEQDKVVDDDTAELKRCLEIVPEDDDDDDVAIKATPLSSKSSTIVVYKIYKEGKKSYFKIIRADGNSQNYLTFGTMFKNFNREYLEVLRSIVKESV